mgnify:FL=1
MFDNTIGIIILVLAAILYLIAFYYSKHDKIKSAVLLVVLAGFIIRCFVASDPYLHPWDERYHALVAKNIISEPLKPTLYEDPVLPYNYKQWHKNHIWVHKQPMPLWMMAASMNVFGVNEFAMRLPSVLLSTLGIWLIFLVGIYFYNRKVAFVSAFLFSLNGLIIELTGGRVATDHYDLLFLIFILSAIYFTTKFVTTKSVIFNILAGLMIAFAILTKWLPALIVLPIWLILAYSSKTFSIAEMAKHFAILVGVIIIISLPWQIYITHTFPAETAWEKHYNRQHIFEILGGRDEPWWFFLERLRINYGELVYIPLVYFLYKLFNKTASIKYYSLAIWIIIPLLFFTVVKTKMQGYILFTSPAIFMITGWFIFYMKEQNLQGWKKYLSGFVIALLLLLPVRYCIERSKLLTPPSKDYNWVTELKAIDKNIQQNAVLFNYNMPIDAMFYTEFMVYQQLPDDKTIFDLQARGYNVYVAYEGEIPSGFEDNRDVHLIELDMTDDAK